MQIEIGDAVDEDRGHGDESAHAHGLDLGMAPLGPGPESVDGQKGDRPQQQGESDQSQIGEVFQIIVVGVGEPAFQGDRPIGREDVPEGSQPGPGQGEIPDDGQGAGPVLGTAVLEKVVLGEAAHGRFNARIQGGQGHQDEGGLEKRLDPGLAVASGAEMEDRQLEEQDQDEEQDENPGSIGNG